MSATRGASVQAAGAGAGLSLHDQPGHLIRRAQQIAVSVFHELLGRDVTPIQYAVMLTLAEQPAIDQLTLAQTVALDTSSAADICARLEAKGWITREVAARGQRRLRLSDAGAGVLASLAPGVQAMQLKLLGGLSEHERLQFMRLLEKFVDLNNEMSRAPLRRTSARVKGPQRL